MAAESTSRGEIVAGVSAGHDLNDIDMLVIGTLPISMLVHYHNVKLLLN